MKTWLKIAACALVPAAFAGEVTQQDILNKIEALQKQIVQQQAQIAEQQAQIEALKGQTVVQDAQLVDIVREEIDRSSFAQTKSGGSITIPDHIANLDIKGSLRLRYELGKFDDGGGGDDDRDPNRFRSRVTLGGVWKSDDELWEVGVGVATAESQDMPNDNIASAGTGRNDDWNENFVWEHQGIVFDYAYAKHLFEDYNLTLTVGQQHNPYTTTWLMFDGDLRPTGATLQYANDMFFANAGAYNIRGSGTSLAGGNNQSLANMYAGQLGVNLSTEEVSATLAVGYFHYDEETSEYQLNAAADGDYQYQIGAALAQVTGSVGEVGLKAFGEVAMNFGVDSDYSQAYAAIPAGYDSEDEDMAWVAGIVAKWMGLTVHYAYAYVEGDSIPAFVADSDFSSMLGGINTEGHKFGASYKLTKNCSIGTTLYLTEMIETNAVTDDDKGELLQFDLNYKF